MKMIYTSTKSKSKPKKKPGWEKVKAEYDAWCKKHGIDPEGKKRARKRFYNDVSPVEVTKPYRRETPIIPSLNSVVTGAVTWANERKVYTGDKMLGIAAMHKSNLVPVFAEEAAIEISQMRRS